MDVVEAIDFWKSQRKSEMYPPTPPAALLPSSSNFLQVGSHTAGGASYRTGL